MLRTMSWSRFAVVPFNWLHAMVIAPANATAKQLKNRSGVPGIDFLEITSETSAAQNGERLRTPAVINGCALLKPMLYRYNPLIPTAKRTASLPQFRTLRRTAAKSRQLGLLTVSNGTESSKAICVRQINSGDERLLAASAENGSCIARSTVVTIA